LKQTDGYTTDRLYLALPAEESTLIGLSDVDFLSMSLTGSDDALKIFILKKRFRIRAANVGKTQIP
jgi:hypothetical protein